jgi:tetratricopeptide (TPR) repeat protein
MFKSKSFKAKIQLILVFFVSYQILSSCSNRQSDKKSEIDNQDSLNVAADSISTISKIDSLTNLLLTNKSASLYFLRAKEFYSTNNPVKAIKDVTDAIALDSTKEEYFMLAGKLFDEIPRPAPQNSLNAYQKAVKINPQNQEAWYRIAFLYFSIYEYDESLKTLEALVKINPLNADAFYLTGLNYKEKKVLDRAKYHFDRALNLDKYHFESLLQLGAIYAYEFDNRALNYYNRALEVEPNNLRALYARGIYYQDLDSFRLAKLDYKKIIEMDRNFLSTQHNLGYIASIEDSLELAIKYFSESIELNPIYAKSYELRGIVYKKLGNTELAQKDFRKAKELSDVVEDIKPK